MKSENIGWQCPNCLVVYSPSVQKCQCSVLPKEPTVSLSGRIVVGAGGVGTITTASGTNTTYICLEYISDSPNGICSKCARPKWNHHNVSYT
jgi:hypothetical protein